MKFSHWEKFDLRQKILNRWPGIYSIAISENDISGTDFDYIKDIVYFGMTNSKTGLKGRLEQFNNTLRRKKGPGHGGAARFLYDCLQHSEDGDSLAKRLYVAVCTFECDVTSIARKDLEKMGAVACAEYLAFAQYAEIYGHLPKYNDKKNSPKK